MASILATQAFAADIAQSLWAANEFLSHAKDDSQWVNYDKVNLPHAGTVPTVTKGALTTGIDNSALTKRTDAASQYSLAALRTTPTWIEYNEAMVVNYNKRQSVLDEHKNALIDALAVNVLHDWAAGGDSEGSGVPSIVDTSGGTRNVGLPTLGGGGAVTGTRKGVAYNDVLEVITTMNAHNIPAGGRYAIISAEMFADLLKLSEFKSSDYVDRKPIPNAPLTFRWLGIDWYVRSFVASFSKHDPDAGTPVNGSLKAWNAASAASDCGVGLFWHKDFVRKAKGGVEVFLNLRDASLQGDKLSALARYGAIGARDDNKGIVTLVEHWVS